jgi:hypothetical protein
MRLAGLRTLLMIMGAWLLLVVLHYPLRSLPYFWDEAGYYALAAADFYRQLLLIPQSTWALGHTPLGAIYVASAWHLFGVSPSVARTAMALLAGATVIATYELGRRAFPPEHSREMAAWSALLLALSPLFFAQSTMLHIDLPATLFLALALIALLGRRLVLFALAASFAFLGKETAVIFFPVAWAYAWRYRREFHAKEWALLLSPLAAVLAWTLFYHHQTGFWTGNRQYLEYNLYSTLHPVRFFLSLARRLYQLLIGAFDWILVGGAILGAVRRRKSKVEAPAVREGSPHGDGEAKIRDLLILGTGLCAIYIVFHSLVGGALLRRYLLPVYPVFYLCAVWYLWRLPRQFARTLCAIAGLLFVTAWFLHGPYSFEFESSLAYRDFVRLHQQAALYLEDFNQGARVLTAWPATGELSDPFLGYVKKPLRVTPIDDFGQTSFTHAPSDGFDVLYLYSRQPESVHGALMRLPFMQEINRRYFDYVPQVSEETLAAEYHLKLLKKFERHGQWVHIYGK